MNIILTAYLTSGKDGHKEWEPYRDDRREANIKDLEPLLNSCKGLRLAIFHDCFKTELPNFIEVPKQNQISSNAYRWHLFNTYLKKYNYNHIFLVDSTDVECYNSPFGSDLGNYLWIGDEKHATVDSPWMKAHQAPYVTMPDYNQIIIENRKHRLLNCGIVGGKREVVLEYLELVTKYQSECNLPDNISVDMAVHNYVIFKHFKGRYKHGVQVNTVFRKNEKPNGVSWWRHK
jgi:hypothetical protein